MINIPIGLILCIASVFGCAYAGRRSTGAGVGAVLAVGYFYGIVRANFLDGFSHFIFDAGIIGFYAVQFNKPVSSEAASVSQDAKGWLSLLIGWPLILFFVPINHILVQLVGLRHIILFLPALLLGARTRPKDLNTIATTLAILNAAVFVFAVLEYWYGITPFYPHNSATDIMYRSHDISSTAGRFFRIPATFTSSHAYAGNLLLTLPLLLNPILDTELRASKRLFFAAATILTVIGVFLAGPRLPVVQLTGFIALMLILPGLKASARVALAACVIVIGLASAYYVASDERMQRFTTLSNTEMVEARASKTLNVSIVDIFLQYPLGVGLGGVLGSSLPFFLLQYAPELVGAENEYVRIACEQGIIGFAMWGSLIYRLASRKPKAVSKRWSIGTHAMWAFILVSWGTAFIGTGMLQGIPNSVLLLLQMGVLLKRPLTETDREATPKTNPLDWPSRWRERSERPGSMAVQVKK
jgi:hypothetical protein